MWNSIIVSEAIKEDICCFYFSKKRKKKSNTPVILLAYDNYWKYLYFLRILNADLV